MNTDGLAMRVVIVTSMLLFISVGCESVSIRVVDASTHQPLQGIPAQLWVKHGDLWDFLMGLPGDSTVDAVAVTDSQGRVVFKWGDIKYINFRSGRNPSLPHLYRLDSQWYVQRLVGSSRAEVGGSDVIVPLTQEDRQ